MVFSADRDAEYVSDRDEVSVPAVMLAVIVTVSVADCDKTADREASDFV